MQIGDGKAIGWWPGFLDYMFVAFNASTAFSPTDTLILSQAGQDPDDGPGADRGW